MKTITSLLFLCLAFGSAYAYFPNGSVLGQVTDPGTKKPVSDATVIFDCQGQQKIFYANDSGYYYASNIPSCIYKVTVMYLSKSHTYNDIKVLDGDQIALDMELMVEDTLTEVVVYEKKGTNPLIDALNPDILVLTKDEIRNMPTTDIGSITEVQAGITAINGEYYVHGARAGSLNYYIDDSQIMGSPEIPVSSLEVYRTYTGFLPPKYGDTTGGAVVMETRSYFSER